MYLPVCKQTCCLFCCCLSAVALQWSMAHPYFPCKAQKSNLLLEPYSFLTSLLLVHLSQGICAIPAPEWAMTDLSALFISPLLRLVSFLGGLRQQSGVGLNCFRDLKRCGRVPGSDRRQHQKRTWLTMAMSLTGTVNTYWYPLAWTTKPASTASTSQSRSSFSCFAGI